MKIDEAIYWKLANTDGITTLIGSRTYPLFVPQNGSYPCIVYRFRIDERHRHSTGKTPLVTGEAEFECWANTEDVAELIASAVFTAIDETLRATWGGPGGVKIVRCTVNTDDPELETGEGHDQTLRYCARRTATIWYVEQ